MKALIVGCGYVGLRLGTELARLGHQVFGVRKSAGHEAELSTAGMNPLLADVCDPATFGALPRDCDWIVNCVATSGGGEKEYQRVYLEGNRNLLDWLESTGQGGSGDGAGAPKFIFTSSTGVYGQDDGSMVDEQSPTSPAAETGKVLVEAERLLLEPARDVGFSAVVLRLAGIYGPGRGYWLKQFLAGEARLEGDGGRFINMVHREDVVGAIIVALERGRPGAVYNVVDNEPVVQIEVLKWLAQYVGRPMPPAEPTGTAAGAGLPSGRARRATNKRVSNRRLREELGYELKFPTFREGFAEELKGMAGR